MTESDVWQYLIINLFLLYFIPYGNKYIDLRKLLDRIDYNDKNYWDKVSQAQTDNFFAFFAIGLSGIIITLDILTIVKYLINIL